MQALAANRTAAFFDLDRTLIDVNSAILWARSEHRGGFLSWRQVLRVLSWAILYHVSLVNAESALNLALAHYRNQPVADLEARTREWFHREVKNRLRRGALPALQEHRAAGHLLVLLTTTSHFAAREAAETWGLDHWIANRPLEDPQGLVVGTCEHPICYGPGKAILAERWALQNGVSLEESFFYTDSYSDRPMLERVGQPRVVAPDPRLRRLARRRGWPVLLW